MRYSSDSLDSEEISLGEGKKCCDYPAIICKWMHAISNTFFLRRKSLVSLPFKRVLCHKNKKESVFKEKWMSNIYVMDDIQLIPVTSALTGQGEMTFGKGR